MVVSTTSSTPCINTILFLCSTRWPPFYASLDQAIYFELLNLNLEFIPAGVLEKVGVQPQVQRIGKYKSFGDQLMRKDMSEANREMLTALLDDIYSNFLEQVSLARGTSFRYRV